MAISSELLEYLFLVHQNEQENDGTLEASKFLISKHRHNNYDTLRVQFALINDDRPHGVLNAKPVKAWLTEKGKDELKANGYI